MMDDDLRDLLSAWLGGAVEPARRDDLLERLGRDEAFRRAFVAEAWMLGKLKAVQSPESRWLRLEDELGWGAAESSAGEVLEDRILDQLQSQALVPRSRRRRWRLAAVFLLPLVLVLVLVLVAVLAPSFWLRRPRPAPAPEVPPYPRIDTLDGLGLVIKLDRVRWEPTGEPHPSEGDVVAAGHLRFQSGRIVLSMLTGVVLFVEGPADLELVSDARVVCHHGRVRVRAPGWAERLVVSGPGSAVVDQGTEFGLNIAPGGTSRTRVFQGRVEAAVTGADGVPQRTLIVKESQAFEIDPRAGRIEPIVGPDDFLAPPKLAAAPLALDDEYPAAIRRSRPWGYWRFESLSDGAVPNEVPGRPPLRVIGPIRLADAASGNRCAELRAVDERQDLELERPWPPPWRPGFAVELWCAPEAVAHATLVSIAAAVDTNNHVFLLELTSRNGLHKPAAVRLLHRWPPGGTGGDNVYARDPYVPYRWHHVVGQFQVDRMELFVDGEPGPTLSIDPAHGDMAAQFLLGRLTTRAGSGISYDRPFVGRLDEVALYDHPLTVEEIRAHHRRGAGRSSAR
jgi:hypothetical protein